MADPSIRASRTAQYLAFAATQLELLQQASSPFQERALKHAVLNSCSNAFLSYLDELEVELEQFAMFQNFENRCQTIINLPDKDFRLQEIASLLKPAESWLKNLLEAERASQTIKKREQPPGEEGKENLIIQVQQGLAPWWELEIETLQAFVNNLKTLISRQREISAEE